MFLFTPSIWVSPWGWGKKHSNIYVMEVCAGLLLLHTEDQLIIYDGMNI